MPRGEPVEGAVREGADQVEVPDHRPRPRARREVVLAGGAAPAAEDGDEEERGGKHGAEGRGPWRQQLHLNGVFRQCCAKFSRVPCYDGLDTMGSPFSCIFSFETSSTSMLIAERV